MKQEKFERRATKRMWELFSCERPDFPGVMAALRQGADPNSRDGEGRPLLYLLQKRRHDTPLLPEITDTVRLMVEKGAHLDEPYGPTRWSPLHLTAYWGQPEWAQLLLNLGANPNNMDEKKKTPLFVIRFFSAEQRFHCDAKTEIDAKAETAFILLDDAADIWHRNEAGLTAFQFWPSEFHKAFLRHARDHGRMEDIRQIYCELYPTLPDASKAVWDGFIDGAELRRSHELAQPPSVVTRYLSAQALRQGGRQ